MRRARRLTIAQAALAAKLDRRHWQRMEAGESNTTLRTVGRIAAALGVQTVELFRPAARKGKRRR